MGVFSASGVANQQHYFIDVASVPEGSMELVELSSDGFSLSSDYQITVTAVLKLPIAIDGLIGKSICISTLWEGDKSYLHGEIIQIMEQGQSHDGEQVQLLLASPFWKLKQRRHNRVFCNNSCLEITKQLLTEAGIQQKITYVGEAPTKPFVVQYEESDYDFIHRLLAHHGFYFAFIQTEQDVDIIITNQISEVNQALPQVNLPFIAHSGQTRTSEAVFAMTRRTRLLTQSVQLNDYNYEQPTELFVQTRNQNEVTGSGNHYHYGDNYQTIEEGEQVALFRQQALDWQRQSIIIDTDCRGLQPGMTLEVLQHPEWSGVWQVISVEHSGNQQGALTFGNIASGLTYRGQATLIPAGMPFRCPVASPRRITGTFSAKICSGLDEQGRYEIQMGFDLQKSGSHPVRLMQPYGGSNHGMHFPFTEGTEVVVTCENGDPDRPVILGALYNSESVNPVTSNNPTENIITTRANNQLILDDKRDAAQIKLHTDKEKNRLHMDATSEAHQIGLVSEEGEVHLTAGTNMIFQAGKNQTVEVGGEHSIVVANDQKLMTEQGSIKYQSADKITFSAESDIDWQSINGGLEISAKEDIALEAGESIRVHAVNGNVEWLSESGVLILNADANITFKSSGNGVFQIAQGNGSIEIDSSGNLIIDAPKVEINADNIAIKGNAIGNN